MAFERSRCRLVISVHISQLSVTMGGGLLDVLRLGQLRLRVLGLELLFGNRCIQRACDGARAP